MHSQEIEPKWDWWKMLESAAGSRCMREPHRDVSKLPFYVQVCPNPRYSSYYNDDGDFVYAQRLTAVCAFANKVPTVLMSHKANSCAENWTHTMARCLRVWKMFKADQYVRTGPCPLCGEDIEGVTHHIINCWDGDIVLYREPLEEWGDLRLGSERRRPSPKRGRKAVRS